MTVHLVTFSDESMSRSRELCARSAERIGGVDDSLQWEHADFFLTDFYRQHEGLLSKDRGLGFWAWKSWIILKALEGRVTSEQFTQNSFYPPEDGDILIYADAGVEFINNVAHIIDHMDQDIFLFGNNWEHAHWCKRDVIEAVWPWCDRGRMLNMDGDRIVNVFVGDVPRQRDINVRELAWERFHKQCQASVIFFRVSDYSRKFVAEWLKWCLHRLRFSEGVCTDEWRYLIDDSPSIAPNHPEFRENRHDQAILTTLAYREGLRLHYWPAVYNRGSSPEFVYEKLPEYAGDTYPILFSHHRRRNHEFQENAA